jgi:starvation-inducible outer membrane lipoprotein
MSLINNRINITNSHYLNIDINIYKLWTLISTIFKCIKKYDIILVWTYYYTFSFLLQNSWEQPFVELDWSLILL